MKALRIERHGPPAELRVREVPRPEVGPDQVLVEVEASGVNPSDVASAAGAFPDSPLPRILGRDFAGRVVEGPADLVGADVWGTGGDLGIRRDGTHAEYVLLPRDAVSRRPPNLPVEDAGTAGLPFITAWSALVDLGGLREGEWVIVSGAAGAVGWAAVQIAHALGAHVVALVKDATERDGIDAAKVAAIAQSDRGELVDVVHGATGDRGCDLALNGVGAVVFQPMIDSLTDGGRMVMYSVAGGRQATIDLFALYRHRLTLRGLNTGVLDAAHCARILDRLVPLFERDGLRVSPISERYVLSAAERAYQHVKNGAPGKVVLLPASH